MFSHCLLQCLDPENQIRSAVSVDGGYDFVSNLGGLFCKSLQCRKQRLNRLCPIELCFDLVKDSGELLSALATRGGQGVVGLARQLEIVRHAEPYIRRKRGVPPLFAGVGKHDQMTGKIATVDR